MPYRFNDVKQETVFLVIFSAWVKSIWSDGLPNEYCISCLSRNVDESLTQQNTERRARTIRVSCVAFHTEHTKLVFLFFFFATCVYTCLFSCFQGSNKWSFTSLIYLYKTSENSDICQCKFLKVQGDVFYCLLLSVQQEQSHWRVCQSTISWSADHCSSLSHSLWAASSIHSRCWKAAGFCCYQPAVIMRSIVWNSLILVQNDQVPIC